MRFPFFITLICCLLITASALSSSQKAIDLNNRAVEFLKSQDWDSAIQMLTQASQINPRDRGIKKNLAQAYLARAQHRQKNEDYALADSDYTQAVRLDPSSEGAWMGYGLISYYQKNFDEATQRLAQAIRRFPKQKEAYLAIGYSFVEVSDLRSAVRYWKAGLEIAPGDPKITQALSQFESKVEAEKNYARSSTMHFEVHYDIQDSNNVAAVNELKIYLEQAYQSVADRLNFPTLQQKIHVVFYNNNFRQATKVDARFQGSFDGRINIPLNEYVQNQTRIKKVIVHELAHALLFQFSKKIPIWFHEGFAQATDGTPIAAAFKKLRQTGLLNAQTIQRPFVELQGQSQVEQAYSQALVMYSVLFNMGGKANLLLFAQTMQSQPNTSPNQVLQQIYRISLEQLIQKAAQAVQKGSIT